jgi:hypothetical protein
MQEPWSLISLLTRFDEEKNIENHMEHNHVWGNHNKINEKKHDPDLSKHCKRQHAI